MSKHRAHDRRGLYRKGQLPKHARFAAVTIEDPYAQAAYVNDDGTADTTARLEQFKHRDGSVAAGAPGWTPPQRPKITVIRSLKDDPLGHMHARRQIDEAEFLAGREYQACYVAAQFSPGKSSMTDVAVDGGGIPGSPLTDRRKRAMARLRMIDIALYHKHGGEGVMLVRDILGEGLTIERAAARRATNNERSTRQWGWLFRRCLDVIAFKFGYASTASRPPKNRRR